MVIVVGPEIEQFILEICTRPEHPNGQTIRTIARAADVRQDRTPGEWNRCKQRPTETQVSNITHCGIGHFQAPNIARDTFLAVTHVPHLFAA